MELDPGNRVSRDDGKDVVTAIGVFSTKYDGAAELCNSFAGAEPALGHHANTVYYTFTGRLKALLLASLCHSQRDMGGRGGSGWAQPFGCITEPDAQLLQLFASLWRQRV